MTEVQPNRQPLSHVNSFPAAGAAGSTAKVCTTASSSPTLERMSNVWLLFTALYYVRHVTNIDPSDWHLHNLLAQLTACIDSKPTEKPPAFYGMIKCQ